MKFWQILSIFREELDTVEEVLADPKWTRYKSWIHNRQHIILSQQREILDLKVEDEVLEAIALKSKQMVYYSKEKRKVYSYEANVPGDWITIYEATKLFNHDKIEEVFEKTEADIE